MALIIKARHIRKSYGTLEVLRGIDLDVAQGEIVSIVGASGAGKTTLLQILGTLASADRGSELVIAGRNASALGATAAAELRNRELGFVFQSHQLLPEFTALENVFIPALIRGDSMASAEPRARMLLERLGLADRAKHRPGEMSGGECQRIAVARALMNEPKVVFADEPSGSLDSANKEELHRLFFRLREELGQTFVIVTHDEAFARQADRMIVLRDGRIEREEYRIGGAVYGE